MTKQAPQPRRKGFYFEIHFGSGHVVSGRRLFSGMLEAEKEVDRYAAELARRLERPQRGYLIMRAKKRKQ